MSKPIPNPVAPERDELEEKDGAAIVPLLSGEPAGVGLGQEKLFVHIRISNHITIDERSAYPGIIMFDHQLGFPIARKVASMSSSERPAIAFTALSCVAATPPGVWGWYCIVS
jgi:hypothetical protein